MKKITLALLSLCLPFYAAISSAIIITIRVGFNPSIITTPSSSGRTMSGYQHNCDGQGILSCQIGTCYTGISNGYIGCCSISSCAARTTCIEYNPSSTPTCDMNTGGCVVCTDPSNPYCVTITNGYANQFAMYCAATALTLTTNYPNIVTSGSMAQNPASTSSSASLVTQYTITLPTTLFVASSTPKSNSPTTSAYASSSDATSSSLNGSSLSTQRHEPISPGAIAGVAGAAVAVIIAMFLAGYLLGKINASFTWKCNHRRLNGDKDNGNTVQQESCPFEAEGEPKSHLAEVEGSIPTYGSLMFSPHTVRGELQGLSTAHTKTGQRVPMNGFARPNTVEQTFQNELGNSQDNSINDKIDKPDEDLAELEDKMH